MGKKVKITYCQENMDISSLSSRYVIYTRSRMLHRHASTYLPANGFINQMESGEMESDSWVEFWRR